MCVCNHRVWQFPNGIYLSSLCSSFYPFPQSSQLAKLEAGCAIERPAGADTIPECTHKIHGMKPSSLLSTYAVIVGMAAAVLMPICGAMVDTTPHRLGLGRALSCLLVLGTFGTIFVSQTNYFAMSIAFAFVVFVGLFEAMTLYAYLPELTNDEATLNRYTRTFAVLSYGSVVVFLVVVVGLSAALSYTSDNNKDSVDDEIGTARISQAIGFATGVVCYGLAWGRLFAPRPPARLLAPHESVWTSGFVQLYHTAVKVHRHHPMLQWFFLSIAMAEAATSALFILALTYLTDVLEFTAAENGAATLIILLSGIPGGLISSWWTRRYNPVSSSIAAVVLLIISTTLAATILTDRDQATAAYLLAMAWGIGTGWKWAVDRLLYATILPQNQNAEFSGAYTFFRQCLTWLPPLVFTLMNEHDVSLRIGMGSINVFFVLALTFLYFGVGIQSYNDFVADTTANNTEVTNRTPTSTEDASSITPPDIKEAAVEAPMLADE